VDVGVYAPSVYVLTCPTSVVATALLPSLGPVMFGQSMPVPSFLKNDPIKVFGYALVPPHSACSIFVKASRKAMQVVEQEPCSRSDAVHPESGVL